MHFDERNLHSRERVTNREASVTVSAGVHENALRATAESMNGLDYLSLSIVLRERELDTELLGDGQEPRLDVVESLGPIETRLTRAEQVEVGTVDDGDSHSPVSPSSQARNFATSSSDSWV